MDWIWRYDQCWNVGCDNARLIYDEKTRTIKCPECGEVRTLSEEEWDDRQTLRRMLYDYMPGQYLFKNLSSKEIASLFLRKLEKMRWIHYVAHDYVLAKLKLNLEAQNRMKEAIRLMAQKMDYNVEECMTLFPIMNDLEKSCDHVPHMIYEIARENFRVEGWRRREDETLHEAEEWCEPEIREWSLYHREWWFWFIYERELHGMYYIYRAERDRVACWVMRELLRKIHHMKWGTANAAFLDVEMDPFLEGLIEDVLKDKQDISDLQELTVQWYLELADEEISNKDYWPTSDAADDAVLALITKLGWKTVPPPIVRINYVQELAEKLRDPEFTHLYEVATDIYDVTDEERMKIARALVNRVKEILTVLPSNK